MATSSLNAYVSYNRIADWKYGLSAVVAKLSLISCLILITSLSVVLSGILLHRYHIITSDIPNWDSVAKIYAIALSISLVIGAISAYYIYKQRPIEELERRYNPNRPPPG